MATIREQILQRIKTVTLTGLPNVPRVSRSRADKFTPDEAPAVNFFADNEQPNEDTIGKVNAMLNIVVEVYHRGVAPDSLADPIVDAIHTKMMADNTMGGLSMDVSEDGTSWDFDEADRTALIVRMRYVIHHRHNRTSLSS